MTTTDPAHAAASLAEVLRYRADTNPDHLAFCFLIDGEEEGPRLSYAELDRQARAIAAALQEFASPGDRAMLIFAPGIEFVSAFFGCQYAGIVPVPVYPPRLGRLAQSWQTLDVLAANCRPTAVLTAGPVASLVASGLGHVPGLAAARLLVTDAVDVSLALRWREPVVAPDDLGLLQYTSGSTAAPKGVMVSHRNLMHNSAVVHTAFDHDGEGVGVCWLPSYHDMGLIGGVLQIVYHGAAGYLMSPVDAIRWPERWLQAMSRYRGDTSGGPNFAFDSCVERIAPADRAGLDLSNWSVAAIGSEPINPGTIERFAAAFEPCGFRPEAFYPCYGLAEATLLVTGVGKSAGATLRAVSASALEEGRAVTADHAHADARTLVGCGHAWCEQEVRIVDPASSAALTNGRVGEIWVKGPSVAQGYWGQPEETERTFRARIAETGEGPYLRTGDLGYLERGELFVTGRLKDLLVIRGRNHYPQDIEETVLSVHPHLRRGASAAIEVVRDGKPHVVIVQEVERGCRDLDVREIVGNAREAVAERHELQIYDLALIEFGSIPKTSSGKVQRHRCRRAYEMGELRRWRGGSKA